MSIDPTTLKGPDPSQWDDREFEGPVPAGRYTFKAPNEFEFVDDEGFLGAVMDLEIQDCPDGHYNTIRYVRASFKPKRSGNGSRLTDYLKACSVEPLANSDAQAAMDAVNQTAGCYLDAEVSWRCWDKDTQEVLANNYNEFPDDPEKPGQKLPYVENPATGKKVPARAGIFYFVR
jgi:hypothetical protein|tara:strand:+ start:2986 stop:3510 length:525 start_codon:yes stop_codon:yes gene_type:complete